MSKAGRPLKPTKLKLLTGNPGKRKLNRHEPDAGDLPPCPEYLSGLAAETYAWLEATMGADGCGVLKASDAKLAEMIAHQWQTLREANEKLAVTGPVIVHTDKDGIRTMRISPYLHVRNGATDRLRTMLGECGMTPSSRQRIVISTDNSSDESSIEAFNRKYG